MTIFRDWSIKIVCFHDSCKISGQYQRISSELSSSFLITFLLEDTRPFKLSSESLGDFFDNS
jgi:hypothetical protein